MPRFDVRQPGRAGSSVYTWGKVMNAPPSMGHDTNWGSAAMEVCPANTGPPATNFGRKRGNANGTRA